MLTSISQKLWHCRKRQIVYQPRNSACLPDDLSVLHSDYNIRWARGEVTWKGPQERLGREDGFLIPRKNNACDVTNYQMNAAQSTQLMEIDVTLPAITSCSALLRQVFAVSTYALINPFLSPPCTSAHLPSGQGGWNAKCDHCRALHYSLPRPTASRDSMCGIHQLLRCFEMHLNSFPWSVCFDFTRIPTFKSLQKRQNLTVSS